VLHPEDRGLARRRVQERLPLRLHAEQPRHERAQRARDLDQQRRFLRRRQVRAVAVRREAPRQRGVPRGQLGAELRIQRRQPLGLVQIAVPEAVDTEREVSRLVARRAPGAVREGKFAWGASELCSLRTIAGGFGNPLGVPIKVDGRQRLSS